MPYAHVSNAMMTPLSDLPNTYSEDTNNDDTDNEAIYSRLFVSPQTVVVMQCTRLFVRTQTIGDRDKYRICTEFNIKFTL